MLVVFALAAQSCSTTATRQPPAASDPSVTDAELTSRISRAFHEEGLEHAQLIEIEVAEGAVTLVAHDEAETSLERAIAIVREIPSVKSVRGREPEVSR